MVAQKGMDTSFDTDVIKIVGVPKKIKSFILSLKKVSEHFHNQRGRGIMNNTIWAHGSCYDPPHFKENPAEHVSCGNRHFKTGKPLQQNCECACHQKGI